MVRPEPAHHAIATQLAAGTSWSGLSGSFPALDVRGPWHPLDPGALPGATAGTVLRMATSMHQVSTLPWITLVGRDGATACRVGGADAVPPLAARPRSPVSTQDRRRLILTVALDPPPTLELSLDQPDPASIAALDPDCRSPGDLPPLEAAARLAELLTIEPLGTRFFRQFKQTFEEFRDALPPGPPAEDRAHLALLQLTRVLFLYFVQSKGWLDGRGDFLARAVDDCLQRRRPLHRDLLRPLFFGALNRRRRSAAQRQDDSAGCPFLNGGLFEPHALERRWKVDMPTPAWRDAFDTLFERFHFTTREGERRASSHLTCWVACSRA